jgi:hypothetical protein
LPENNGATWLIASNFNALEFTSSKQRASHGVTCYVHDRTQGPYASLGCGGALIYRNYFAPHVYERREYWGQVEQEINMLERTALGPYVRHGYCEIRSQAEGAAILQKGLHARDFQVVSHRFCEVTTSQNASGQFYKAAPGMICHQVFAAALNYQGSVYRCEETRKIGQTLLENEYRLAVLCAWENRELMVARGMTPDKYPGMNKLQLVLLGGGVFGNPGEIIWGAIAACEQLIVDSGLDVFVSERPDMPDSVRDIMRRTGGGIIQL